MRIANLVFGNQDNNQSKTTRKVNRTVPTLEQLEDRLVPSSESYSADAGQTVFVPNDALQGQVNFSGPKVGVGLFVITGQQKNTPADVSGQITVEGDVAVFSATGLKVTGSITGDAPTQLALLSLFPSSLTTGAANFTLNNNPPAPIDIEGTITLPQDFGVFSPTININKANITGGNIYIAAALEVDSDFFFSNDFTVKGSDTNSPADVQISNDALIKGETIKLAATRDIDLTSTVQIPPPDLLDAAQSLTVSAGRDLNVSTAVINIRSLQDIKQSNNNSYFTAGRDITFNDAGMNDFYPGDYITMSAGQTLLVETPQEFFLPQNFSMNANTIDFENSQNLIIARQDPSGNASLNGNDITFNNSGIQASVPLTVDGAHSETFNNSFIVDSLNNLNFTTFGNFKADHSDIAVEVYPENRNPQYELNLSIFGNNVTLQNNSTVINDYGKDILIQYQTSFTRDSATVIETSPTGQVIIQKVTNVPPSPPPAPPTPPSPSNPPSSNQPANNSSTTLSSSSISFFDLFLNIFAAKENKLIGEFQQWESDLFKGNIAAAIAEENLMINDLLQWDYVKNSLYEFATALGITPETFAILAITKTIPITQAQQVELFQSSH